MGLSPLGKKIVFVWLLSVLFLYLFHSKTIALITLAVPSTFIIIFLLIAYAVAKLPK